LDLLKDFENERLVSQKKKAKKIIGKYDTIP
jgi:hypothetical protein